MGYVYTGPDLYCEFCSKLVRSEDVAKKMTQIENLDTEDMVSVHKGYCKTRMLKIYGGN